MDPKKHKAPDSSGETPPASFNDELDPDNATSPLDYEERRRRGEKLFYPDGDPEGEDLDET